MNIEISKSKNVVNYKWKSQEDVFKNISKSEKFQKVYNEELIRLQLAAQFRETRAKLKMTQQFVARKSGMTQSVIARVESGKSGISLGTLGRISHSLGRSIKLV